MPLLPALPDEGVREACRACAASQCQDARASCLEDDACTALLRCKGTCSDPACLERCEVENGRSAWYEDYLRCVLETTCAVACAQGQSFGCLGRYAVQSGRVSSYAITWHFGGGIQPDDPARSTAYVSPALGGASLRACTPISTACETAGGAQGIAAVDGYNRARMTLEGTPFRGYLELAGGPYDERALLYLEPVSGPQWREFGMVSRLLFISSGVVAPLDFKSPHHVAVLLAPVDCLLEPAPGVHFLLDGQPFEQIAYFGVDNESDPNGPTSAAGFAFAAVDTGDGGMRQVVVEARSEDDIVLSRRSVLLLDDWSTQIQLLPRERGEP